MFYLNDFREYLSEREQHPYSDKYIDPGGYCCCKVRMLPYVRTYGALSVLQRLTVTLRIIVMSVSRVVDSLMSLSTSAPRAVFVVSNPG